MADTKQRLMEIQKTMQMIGKDAPGFITSFMAFKNEAEKEGVLDKKTKKLIAIALAIVTKCEWCVSLHVKEALDAGATPPEIMEASFIAALMGGAPSLMFAQTVLKAVEELAKP
ncbi:MAG: carboxymuconolactone decarboxylase family protein [Candidatus Lokiarchaeota archaeon]|nr:carboxymuconolactone decarboxylase family protein [Candidatus Lokiarchaeota archaeon]